MPNVSLSDLEAVNVNGLPRGRGFCKDIVTGNLLWDDGETIKSATSMHVFPLSAIVYTNGKLTSWTDGGISYAATYRFDGKLNTVTGGGIVKTWVYNPDGSVNRIDVGAA